MIRSATSSAFALTTIGLIGLIGCEAQAPTTAPATAPASTTAPGTPAAGALGGTYKITAATNPGGAGGYSGAVQIAQTGEHFTIDWNIANSPAYKGIGIVEGSVLGVGWGTGSNYGVAVYKVDGGTLSGKWATFMSKGKVGTESLSGPAGLNGEYKIMAAMTPGSDKGYAGAVTIVPNGSTYTVTWKLANETYAGVGILTGNVLVVGWGTGGGSAGVVSYGVSAGKLDGKWAQPGGAALGTETLAKN